jgi:membrane protein DedA with SNARE-associated domain
MPDLALLTSDPLLLALALFAATLVAEDAATIAAGVLVGGSGADPLVALSAVIAGTALGDLALYGAGRWGGGTALGARLQRRADVARVLTRFSRHILGMLVVARFVPGMRLPVFTASGLAAVPLRLVAAVVLLSTPVWTSLLFEVARVAGANAANEIVSAALMLGAMCAILLLVPHGLKRMLLKQ